MLTFELSSYLLEVPNDSYPTLVDSDWLFNTQSRVLQADWFILEINEKATLNINMPYLYPLPLSFDTRNSDIIKYAHLI